MIERFVKFVGPAALICFVTICLPITGVVHAQQTQQAPETPKPPAPAPAPTPAPADSQETTEVETPARRVKPRLYKTWLFSAGAGANLPSGTTEKFVRGGAPAIDAGAARNFSKYFGLRADFNWTDLPLRASALQLAQAPSGSNRVYGLTFDPVIYIPASPVYSGYVFIGPGFFHRSGKLDSSTAVPGSSCNQFWDWWGTCLNSSLPLGTFLKESENQLGYNLGGGIARKTTEKIDIYAEFRALHGSHNGNTTDVRTLTLGVRW